MDVVKYIRENDRLFDLLEVEILEVGKNFAKVGMVVKDEHLNAAKVCHGAVIFALADLAFGLASNSCGKLALTIDVSISYFRTVNLGDKIVAEAKEVYSGNKTATYIIEVKRGDEIVALAKGTVFKIEKVLGF
ncbi:MAG: hotdog fold thioesterase [Archaeoglobaceae archaeon]|nr:hotdog fold thioesterase [Archaeoglobaceae archaeon]MCX8152109.1 hotdog fold thioesterase [Archaeoglobaceae archaeon]MDW8013544.1 hotdog fold thioesterase [Archaeoglobaceae archaeon]